MNEGVSNSGRGVETARGGGGGGCNNDGVETARGL